MIHQDLGFSVNIRAGVNGPILQEYDSEGGRISRAIEAVTDTVLCTQLTLHHDFKWFDADGLYVAIRYGSRDYQIELWIPKASVPQVDDEEDWIVLQIPGKNVLDTETNQIAGCQYRFAELETWQCDKTSREDCPDSKNGTEKYLGAIWVSIKRRKVKNGHVPTSVKDKAPKLCSKACQHSRAVRIDGLKHTVKKEQVAPFELGALIQNPKLDELTDLDAGKNHSNFMNSIYLFRAKEQLSRVIESHVKSDSDEPSTDPSDIPRPDKNVVTSKASKNNDKSNAVLAKNALKKRSRVQADGNTPAETDSSLNAGASTRYQHKKSKKSEKANPDIVGPISPTAQDPKAQEEERESLLYRFTQEPKKDAKSREKASHAGPMKDSLRPRGSDSGPKAPPTLGRSSMPDYTVLNDEYLKLNAARNAHRQSKAKRARASSDSSNQSDQAAIPDAPMPRKTRSQRAMTSKNARRSPSTSSSSDSDQSSESGSSTASVPEKELDGPQPRTSTGRNSALISTDLESRFRTEDPAATLTTPEREIKALRDRKERLQERVKRKLEAECEELERYLQE